MASILNQKGNYSLALDYLKRLKDKEPDNSRALRLAGLNHMALGDYEQARSSFASALLISPDDPASLYLLGVTAEALNMETLAGDCYTKVLAENPGFGDVIHRYATLLMEQGDVKAVDNLIARLFETNRDNPYLHYVAALVDVWAGRWEGAEKHFNEAMLSKIPLGEAHVGLANLYLSRGRIKDAVSTLEGCTTKIPGFEAAWTGLAGIYLKTGKPLEALAVMEEAEKKLPTSPVILGNFAWLYLETDSNLELVLGFARKAYEQSPENPAIADTLAWAYYKKGAFSQAAWLLAAVEAEDPENGLVLYHHGMALYGLGRLSEAVEKLRQAARTELEEPQRIRIREILAHVENPEDEQQIHPLGASGYDFDLNSFELESSPFKELEKLTPNEDMLEPQWQ